MVATRDEPMPSTRTPFVLLIDDASSIRAVIAGVLRGSGLEVEEAEDGAVGMTRLRARVPDLVVCDLEMPNMDGAAFCRAVRGNPTTQALPIVILSGADRASMESGFAAGCDVIVAKPCSAAILVAAVWRLLEPAVVRPTAGREATA
jgi:CheY-like chemotaxis protein